MSLTGEVECPTTRSAMWGRPIKLKVLALMRAQGEPMSAPVLALMLEISTEEAERELGRLFIGSQVEMRQGDDPVYRLPGEPSERNDKTPVPQLAIHFQGAEGPAPLRCGRGYS